MNHTLFITFMKPNSSLRSDEILRYSEKGEKMSTWKKNGKVLGTIKEYMKNTEQ